MLVRQSSRKRTTEGTEATQDKYAKISDPSASSALSAVSLIADDRNNNLPSPWNQAVLEKKNALPRSEGHRAVADGDSFARAGHGHAEVAGRVIRPFHRMDMPDLTVRGDAVEEFVQIFPGRGIGVLVDDEACAGMANKHRDDSLLQAGCRDDARDLFGDFVTPAAGGWHFERFGFGDHDPELSMLIPQPSTP